MRHKSLTAFLLLSIILSLAASGQKQINSPYARFNIGNIEPSASVKSLGMGGVGIAMTSDNSVFFSNPASYSAIDTNSFHFDIGLDYGIIKLKDGQKHFKSDDMNFDHLIMGFPLAKGIGIAVGIVPMSNGYYKLSETVLKTDPDYDPLVGQYSSQHNGEGGFNNLFLGTGVRLTKNFSAGVNLRLLFGQLKRAYLVTFNDYSNVYNNSATEKLDLHGINFDYGLQYKASLKHDYFITAGFTYSTGKNFKTDYQLLAFKYTAYNNRDTISFVANDTSKTFIPGTVGLGITIGKMDKFVAGFDYITTKWSGASIPGSAGYAADSRSYRFGLEYIPDKYSNYSLLRRVEYRVGAHFGDTYLVVHNDQIKEYGASFGIGIPLRRTHSRTNFYFDYTKRYSPGTEPGHIENFFTFGASLNFWDAWFIKRKYD